jgi:hypothetical protein
LALKLLALAITANNGAAIGADYRCSHSIARQRRWLPDDVRLSDIEARFVCQACGKHGADVRPDFNWGRQPGAIMAIGEELRKRPPTEAALV